MFDSVAEVLFHTIQCTVVCIIIHFGFHKKVDKKHDHVNIDEITNRVYNKLLLGNKITYPPFRKTFRKIDNPMARR